MAGIVIVLMGLYILIVVDIAFVGILSSFSFIDLKLPNALLDSFLFHLNSCH